MMIRYCFILLLMALGLQLQAQCPTPSQAMSNVVEVQKSDTPVKHKISQLETLRQNYLQCNEKDSAYARIVHRLGDVYKISGDYENGLKYTKEAVEVNSTNSKAVERSYLVNSYYNLGVFHRLIYLFPESHQYLDSCIAIGLAYPDKAKIVSMAFEQKAFSFYRTGDYQKCIDVADRGILLAQKLQDSVYEAILLSQKAQSQLELSQVKNAEQNIVKAINVLTVYQDAPYLATAYSIYAYLLSIKKDYSQAIAFYNKAFNLNKELGNWAQCARDKSDLGYLYDQELHDAQKAIACYQEGIIMAKQADDQYQLAGLYNNIGSIYSEKRQYNKALRYYQSGLTVLPVNFTDTNVQNNPSAEALKQVANDYFVFTLLSNKGESFLGLYKSGNVRSYLNDALKAYKAADALVDQMRWKQFGEQSKLYWRGRTKKMYQHAIESCYLLNDGANAYFFFEKSRAVLLNDKLNELGAKKFISLEDRRKEQELRVKVVSASGSQLLTAQDDWESFIKALEKNYPAYYQYKYENAVQPLQQLQQKLAADSQSLVEYFTGDSVIYALFITPKQITITQTSFPNYANATADFLAICSDKNALNKDFKRYRTVAYQLYRHLFKPLNVPKGRVIISPDDAFIPFEALVSDSLTNNYLLNDYAFSYTYSAGFLMKPHDAGNARKYFLGIAPVQYNAHLQQQPLNGSVESLRDIQQNFQSTIVLSGKDASKEAFMERFKNFTVVQLYSHADADSIGREPVLYMADSIINLSEIQSLENVGTEMIVLSACQTGIGRNIRGEGVFSLARGFAAIGIPATITTLWQVQDKATYQITESFYKYLNQGLPKDVALQKARLEFIASGDKSNELPYYWAPAIVLGKADKLVEDRHSRNFPLIMGAVALAIILLFIFLSRKPK